MEKASLNHPKIKQKSIIPPVASLAKKNKIIIIIRGKDGKLTLAPIYFFNRNFSLQGLLTALTSVIRCP
jgi:hypothetical protein